MEKSRNLFRSFRRSQQYICPQCFRQNTRKPSSLLRQQQRRHQSSQPVDDPAFKSILDKPPILMRSGRKHKPIGLAILAAIPITAFFLGCWQVKRLEWKSELIARFEDRLVREPLPLPHNIDPEAIKDFDYRRVVARGKYRHDKEMLIGPRIHDGNDGYLVITPLERIDNAGRTSTVLVCRGWIPKAKAKQSERQPGLPTGEVQIEGLLREPWKKNIFTPANSPESNTWHFPDVAQMAAHVGSQAVWVEETMKPNLLESYRREEAGIPIGRPPEVNLRNNHVQYIFTWFSLSAATTLMLWMVVRKPPGGRGFGVGRGVRESREW
ncbi:surf-like protein [Saxophila tyrrhenica]|uniref:SURF1-like protein n=1 Tax=Saxophila tyrrhenica TaxID=1690608 RepID=A0AAV9NWI2_9PEZI|nr:surf-like protein [Saxophila tyrrhenica]